MALSLSDIWGGLFGGISDNLGAIGQGAGLAGGAALVNEAYQNIGDVGESALNRSNALASTAIDQTRFRPFTVTTNLGNMAATPEGGYTMNLSPEQEALQRQLFGGAGGFFNQATQPMDARIQDVYNRLRATQTPEEERQRLALEERLMGQGRLGVSTAQYGGTPEQLALAKAQEEAKNQAALYSIEQAQKEQAQAAELGKLFMTSGYLPLNAMLSAYEPGLAGSQLSSELQRIGAELFGEASMGGVNALLASRLAQGNLAGQFGSALATGALNSMNSEAAETGSSALGSAFEGLFGWLGGLFDQSGGRMTSGSGT